MTERQSKLIKLVNLYQKIEVSRLAELLDVSQVTIRKDLDHLEEEGLLSREHGYALIKNANDINTRLTINYDKKLEIATKAAEMVSNGETVMLESGSTCRTACKVKKRCHHHNKLCLHSDSYTRASDS